MMKAAAKAAFAAAEGQDRASVEAALASRLAGVAFGSETSFTVAELFPAGVDSVTIAPGAVVDGTITYAPQSLEVVAMTVTATDTGVSQSWSATITPAYAIELDTAILPAAGTDVNSGETVTWSAPVASAEYQVLPNAVVTIVNGAWAGLRCVGPGMEIGYVVTSDGGFLSVSIGDAALDFSLEAGGMSISESVAIGESERIAFAFHIRHVGADAEWRLLVRGQSGLIADIDGDATGFAPPSAVSMRWPQQARIMTPPLPLSSFLLIVEAQREPETGAVFLGEGSRIAQVGKLLSFVEIDALLVDLLTISDPLAAGTALSEVMPATLTVGAAISPTIPGTPAQNGPSLLTSTNSGTAGNTNVANRAWVAGDAGYYSFDVTAPQNNHVLFDNLIEGLPVGTVLIIENLAASPKSFQLYAKVGANVTLDSTFSPGETYEYTIPTGFEVIRCNHLTGLTGNGFRVRIRVKDAIPAVPEQLGSDIDFNPCFSGGVGARTITVQGLPAGVTATAGVISGEAIPAAGSGGPYEITVTATDGVGAQLSLQRAVDVLDQNYAVTSVSIVNENGGATFAVGDFVRIATETTGYPAPVTGGIDNPIFPQFNRVIKNQSGVAIVIGGGVVQIPAGTTSIRGEVRLKLDATPTYTDWALSPDYAVSAAVAGTTAPTILTQTSATVAGRVVTIALGTAQGEPTPSGSVTALTVNGADALGQLSGGEITVSGSDEANVAWTVTWTNSAGSATSTGSATVAATGSMVPAAPAPDEWRVSSAVSDGATVYLAVDAIPADATAIQYQIGAGAWTATDKVSPGVFAIGGVPAGAQDWKLRFVNASGAGSASAVKIATATAATDTRFACWADGEVEHVLSARPNGAGVNTILSVAGGGEAEIVDWVTSNFYTRRPDPADKVAFRDAILFDPLGTAQGLKPAQTAERTFASPLGTTTVVIHGAAGMFAHPAMAAVGFDADNDPVDFLFTRQRQIGRLPDGRPFVVGPVSIAHNGGDPVTVTPNATTGYSVVSDRGAKLCVVARPGIVPPLDAAATDLGLSHDYVRRDAAYNFAADGWDDGAARTATNVETRANFEHIGVYYNSGAAGVKMRFRKKGTSTWFPARNLHVDNRNLWNAAPFNYDAKNIIRYLVPGTTYEIELKDGATYKRVEATTRARKVAKTSLALGEVVGTLRLSRSGDVVTVTFPDNSTRTINCPAGGYAELRDGVVRGNISITDGCARVILTRVSVLGSVEHAISYGTNCSDLRIVGGRFAGWGKKATYWMKHLQSVIWGPGFSDQFSATTMHGALVGSPRYSANHWNETGDKTPQKPWGGNIMGADGGASLEPISFLSNAIVQSDFRLLADGLGNVTFGPEAEILRNYIANTPDDGIEIEGQCPCAWVAHNWVRLRYNRPNGRSQSAVAMSPIEISPIVIERNVYQMEYRPDVLVGPKGPGGYKQGRSKTQQADGVLMGDALIAHETLFSTAPARTDTGSIAEKAFIVDYKAQGTTNNTRLDNCLYLVRVADAQGLKAQNIGAEVIFDAAPLNAANALGADGSPIGSALIGTAAKIAGVNDGGPFWKAAPNIGALP